MNGVQHIYRDAGARFDQVLIGTSRANVFLVVVVDLTAASVFGHFLLDLNEQYGLSGGHDAPR